MQADRDLETLRAELTCDLVQRDQHTRTSFTAVVLANVHCVCAGFRMAPSPGAGLATAGVRDALIKAETLRLKDLLTLRQTCKALHSLITGSMPDYFCYELKVRHACRPRLGCMHPGTRHATPASCTLCQQELQ